MSAICLLDTGGSAHCVIAIVAAVVFLLLAQMHAADITKRNKLLTKT